MNGLPLITPGHLRVVPMREGPTLQYKSPSGTEANSQQPKKREDGEGASRLSLSLMRYGSKKCHVWYFSYVRMVHHRSRLSIVWCALFVYFV